MFSEHVIKVLIKKGKEWMWNQVDTESGDRVADFQLPLFEIAPEAFTTRSQAIVPWFEIVTSIWKHTQHNHCENCCQFFEHLVNIPPNYTIFIFLPNPDISLEGKWERIHTP